MDKQQTHAEAGSAIEENGNQYLDTVIDQLRNRQEMTHSAKLADMQYPQLYKNLKNVLEGYNTTFSQCKKYNEAKIHRKYEILTADLQQQVKILRERVNQQRKARSPSQKYVEKLLDQLVSLKHENESLRNQIRRFKEEKEVGVQSINPEDLSARLRESVGLGSEIGLRSTVGECLADGEFALKIPSDSQSCSPILKTINEFLSKKRTERKVLLYNKSPFERYLTKSKPLLSNWSLLDLLQNTSKWSRNLISHHKDSKSALMKLRILSTLEDQTTYRQHMNLPKIEADRDRSSMGTNKIRFFRDHSKNCSTLSARRQCYKPKLV